MGFCVYRGRANQHQTLAYLLVKLLTAAGVMDERALHLGFHPVLQNRLRTPWKLLELLSLMPAVVYRVVVFLLLGRIVICDRYVIDSLVSLSYFLRDPSLLNGRTASGILSFVPRNSILVHLDADVPLLLERRKNEPLTPQMIQYCRQAYGEIARRFPHVAKYDTTLVPPAEVHRQLCTIVDKRLGISR
jgi:thymidylate kinase